MVALRTLEAIMNLVPLDQSFYDLFFAKGCRMVFWHDPEKTSDTEVDSRTPAGEGRRTGALAAKTRYLLRDTLKSAGERG